MATRENKAVGNFARNFTNALDIDTWLRANSVYRGENEEIIRTPDFMLDDLFAYGILEGDCDDFSTLAASMCSSLGIPCRFVAVRTEVNNPEFTHVFVEANQRGETVRIDPTVFPDTIIPEFDRMELTV